MDCDVLIIGGGIAGLSLAWKLAPEAKVVLVEAEETLAYHTSSRSARQMQPSYGPGPIKELTRQTIQAVREISAGFETPILAPRPLIFVGSAAEVAVQTTENPYLRPLGHAQALELIPELRPESFESACLDDSAMEVDVAQLLEFYRSAAVAAGTTIITGAGVHTASRTSRGWTVGAGEHGIHATTVVNAAGAWADPLAVIFGVQTLGLTPHRRTAAIVSTSLVVNPSGVMVGAADDSYYYRPDGVKLLISPCESVPSIAEDAQANAADVDRLVGKINALTTLGITGVERAWTGLRTSPKDGLPMVGFDAEAPGFFWLVGQGGYGIQTSAAMAGLASRMLLAGAGSFDGSAADQELAAAMRPDR